MSEESQGGVRLGDMERLLEKSFPATNAFFVDILGLVRSSFAPQL